MSEWKETTLGNLIEIKHGWAFKGEHLNETNEPKNIVVAIGNFDYSGGFRFNATRTKEYLDSYPKDYELAPGDILMAMTCQTAGGEILGIPGRIPDDGKMYLHNQRLGKVEIRDLEETDPSFVYWLCLWRNFNHHLVATATGTKILHTAPERIKSFVFECPPIDEQKQIGKTLDALDLKIENLRRQNETLEAIAQTLFKHWFVDFEFPFDFAQGKPNADGKPYKSSGGEMVPSELGEIPAGWRVGTLGDEVETLGGGTPSTKEPDYWIDGNIPWYSPTDLTKSNTLFSLGSEKQITRLGLEKSSAKLFPAYSILLTSRATIGEITINTQSACTNQGFITLVPNEKFSFYFLHGWLLTQINLIKQLASGSTFPELSKSTFRKFLFLAPDPSQIEEYDKAIKPLFQKVENNIRQIQTLTETRDVLLPKLMSGKLRIQEELHE
ncbi:MAG: restriction endonuclease subunit S [Cyanobacteria bacterium]|nr:restriction endonuclease subunit S [Cyanobacteriota bacterium]